MCSVHRPCSQGMLHREECIGTTQAGIPLCLWQLKFQSMGSNPGLHDPLLLLLSLHWLDPAFYQHTDSQCCGLCWLDSIWARVENKLGPVVSFLPQ